MRVQYQHRFTVMLFPLVLTLLLPAAAVAQTDETVDYGKAERFLRWNTTNMISGDEVTPHWMAGGNRFWYRNKTRTGAEFVLVDPPRNVKTLLFDNARMAAAMTVANDTSYDPVKLPFKTFELVDNESAIEFRASKKRFHCSLAGYVCTVGDTVPGTNHLVVSPDSAWDAFAYKNNLYIRPHGGGDSIQLTSDGVKYWSYGVNARRPRQIQHKSPPSRPNLVWSPDSKKLVVGRTDERNVKLMHYISYTPQRPKHYSQPYALPGDSIIPVPAFHVIDITRKETVADEGDGAAPRDQYSNIPVSLEPKPLRISIRRSNADSTWNRDSERFYVTFYRRASKARYLARVDAATGEWHIIVGDSAKTFVESSPGNRDGSSWYVTEDENDVIWWSERDGWAHLYRFDGQGNLKNRITSGPWVVSSVKYVDEAAHQIYFSAMGREADEVPYYAHLYRVNFDGTGLRLLTPERGNHTIRFSPSGDYFVDSYSRIEMPPVTLLRSRRDGRVIRKLEEADVSRLVEEIGWKPAEVFTVKARDGITDLYGVIYFPPQIDSTRKYPIISHIYPGPFIGSVGRWTFKGGGEDFSLARLGFVVIQLDAMGTSKRSKAFHDKYYGNFGDNGIPDHIAAIKQLAARYPFIDLDRVGIYGHSGGGFASTDAILRYPEFFKVAVSGAGNHDNRSYNIYWAEKYQGELVRDSAKGTDNYTKSANKTMAANLKGKLLLMHGDMDDNVHPANTIQLVDRLIKANKDFDLIWAPNRNHGLNEPYFIRRRWDYFVRYLLDKEPPKEYKIVKPEN